MTCLDCLHCKAKDDVVRCAKGNWFGQAYVGEITFKKEFLDTAPKLKKRQLAHYFKNCQDFVSSI